jgi:hypothetical protein
MGVRDAASIKDWTEADLLQFLRKQESVVPTGVQASHVQAGSASISGQLQLNQQVRYPGMDVPILVTGNSGGGFSNAWVNSGSVNEAPAQYFKDIHGWVHLRGLIKSGTIGATAFVLLPAYRPKNTVACAVASNGAFAVLLIDNSGNVTPNVGSNLSFRLDGVRFPTNDAS